MGNTRDAERDVVLRILDANANRCAEGLRVIEEIARFGMGNVELASRLKHLRHSVRRCWEGVSGGSCEGRDSRSDIGRNLSTPSERVRGSLTGVAKANFARSEEALRVLEEFSKLVRDGSAEAFKRFRFELYTIEQDFFERCGVRIKLPPAPFLYAVLDRGYVGHADVADTVTRMLSGGAQMIQYRAKNLARGEMRADLVAIMSAVSEVPVPVIVNDDPELAWEVGSNGVHLGSDDPSPHAARELLGPNRIIGLTIHSTEELAGAPLDVVEYIAVGSVFRSRTKQAVREVGLRFLADVCSTAGVPVVAIGGIDASNAASVIDAGADGIAVVSGILEGDVEKNCFTLREIIARRGRMGPVA